MVSNFPNGHVVAFTANGNRLRHEVHNDNIQVIDKKKTKNFSLYQIEYMYEIGKKMARNGRETAIWSVANFDD